MEPGPAHQDRPRPAPLRGNPAMPRHLIPARAPARPPLRNEPEIARRDPHSPRPADELHGAIPPGMPMRHIHTNSPSPRFPDVPLRPHFPLPSLARMLTGHSSGCTPDAPSDAPTNVRRSTGLGVSLRSS